MAITELPSRLTPGTIIEKTGNLSAGTHTVKIQYRMVRGGWNQFEINQANQYAVASIPSASILVIGLKK